MKGEYVFRRFQHDFGNKTVLGKTGNFDGGEVLDILLDQKQTAKYITKKIYKFFVNEKIDEAKVEWLADRFHKNDYEIAPLLEDIFTSDWFYEEKNIGTLIKSPVELLVGIQRMLPMKLENEEALMLLQRILGQLLFYPPNVAGWPGGKSWIDSSSLMMRMRIPMLINDIDELNVSAKDDDDVMMGMKDIKKQPVRNSRSSKAAGRMINADVNWNPLYKNYETVPREKLADEISKNILQVKSAVSMDLIKQYSDQTGRKNFIKSATLQIMSTPEYQLC